MRRCFWSVSAFFVLLGLTGLAALGKTPSKDRLESSSLPLIHSVLREASELALKQGNHERFWIDTTLLQIADRQTRSGDFDGAISSLRGSNYPYGRGRGLLQLIEALALGGRKERALEVSQVIKPDFGLTRGYLQDVVQIQWVEHLIAKGDLQEAAKDIKEIASLGERSNGLRKLAVAYGKLGRASRASNLFTEVSKTDEGIVNPFDRLQAQLATVSAQVSAGASDDAREALLRLAAAVDKRDAPREKCGALWNCALLAAKLKDKVAAQSLFDRAVKCVEAIDESNRVEALQHIAQAQADVGFIDGALKTAAKIKHNERDFTHDGYRESALCSIAAAQIEAGDSKAAVRTALLIDHFTQYRDDALSNVVAYHIGKRDLKAALTTTEKFASRSRKTAAILKVAVAQAKAGDRKKAADIASQIKLNYREGVFRLQVDNDKGFQFERPQSWGESYEMTNGFTMASYRFQLDQASQVAAAAIELAQALEFKPAQSYSVLFKDVNQEIAQALAKSHAQHGNANDSLAWAKQIGSAERIPEKEGDEVRQAVGRRVYALLGAADGMLEVAKK